MKKCTNLIKKIVIISYFIFFYCVCCSVSVSADDGLIQYEKGSYKFGEDGWTLLKYNGTEKAVALPAMINGRQVTKIAAGAFADNAYIERINIPYSIKKIEGTEVLTSDEGRDIDKIRVMDGIMYDSSKPGAFVGCSNLEYIFIDDNSQLRHIGAMAFYGCICLKEINMPEKMDEIGEAAFYQCENLTSIIIPDGIKVVERLTFKGCYSLKTLKFPVSLNSIECRAFEGCREMTDISLPEGVEKVDDRALAGVSLKEIKLGKKLSYIDYSTFANCYYLDYISVDEDNPYYSSEDGALYNKDKTVLYIYPKNKRETCYIPASVKTIASGAFEQCKIEEVIIPEGVKEIEELAFFLTGYLKKVNIPSSVDLLDERAFWDMNALEEINVSKDNNVYVSVDGILYTKDMKSLLVYPSCKREKEFVIPEGVERAYYKAFEDVVLNKIVLPSTYTEDEPCYMGMFGEVEAIEVSSDNKKFSSEDGILYTKNMDRVVWYPNGKHDEVYIMPETVKVIGATSINEQKYMKKLFVQEGVEIIECDGVFKCEALEYVSLPKSLKVIDRGLWVSKGSVKAISLPGETTIDELWSTGDTIYTDIRDLSSFYNVYSYDEHEKVGHQYEEQVLSFDREDCMLHTCIICGHMKKTTICSHVWEKEYIIDKESTCIMNGLKSLHCTKCEKVKEVVIETKGHDFCEWESVKVATCDDYGVMKSVCMNCGHIVDKLIDKKKHEYSEWEIVVFQGCKNSGSRKRTCKICKHVEVERMEATGHSWNEFYTTDIEATCTKNGKESIHCANCNEVKNKRVIRTTGHEIITGEKKEATCTSEGHTGRKQCIVCYEIIEDEKVLPMTEHKFDEWRVEKEATYEEKGVKSRICMVCGCVENEVIPVTEVEKNQENVKEEKPLYKAPEMIVFIHNNQMQLPEKSVKNENGNKKKQIINVSKKADKTVVYKSSKIKKKKVSFDIAAKAEGRITYKVTKGAKYISVSKKGKVTIKKKTKKGTYKILVTASDTARSFGAKRYIYIKIK